MESFVIRIYRRGSGREPLAGTLEEVGTGRRYAFHDAAELVDLLGRRARSRGRGRDAGGEGA